MNSAKQTLACGLAAVVLAAILPLTASAQSRLELEVGVAGGVPIGNPFEPSPGLCCGTITGFVNQDIENTSYTVGPFFALHPLKRIRVSFGALYMPVGFKTTSQTGISTTTEVSTHGAAWEFPLLANYEFLRGSLRPFGGGGLVLTTIISGGQAQPGTPIISGGLEWRFHQFSIRPEYRFAFYSTPSQPKGLEIIRDSGQQFLVGFSFRN